MALGCSGLPAFAQDPRLARFEASLARDIQGQLDSAQTDRLPTEPLLRKALEGRSKGASAERIVAAVRAVRRALADSRAALGALATEPELVAGAHALRAGIEPASLVLLRRERSGPVSVPLDIMTDLVARGVQPVAAASAVERLVRQGRNDGELVRLREQLDRDVRTGLTPKTALERRLAGIPAAGPPKPP
jgi:hypothetical protein